MIGTRPAPARLNAGAMATWSAARVSGTISGRDVRRTGPRLQRQTAVGPAGSTPAEALTPEAPPQTEATTTGAPGPAGRDAGGFIVEDDAIPGPGQMRKSEFLAEVRPAVCAAADAELARAGQTMEECPYLERTFERAAERSPDHLERLVRRYAQDARGASSARDYIPLVAARAARAAATWAQTGELDVPPELAAEMRGAGSLLGGIASAVGGLFSGFASAVSGIVSGIGRLFTLAEDDSATPAEPSAVRASLGPGRPLDTGVRSPLEAAFGRDFSSVRIHTDQSAERAAAQLHARAFTIGRDVAFAPGQYRPGTPEGDAVLAHELAHVTQQGTSSPLYSTRQPEANEETEALEADANAAAAAALARTSAPDGGDGLDVRRARRALALLRREAVPRLRSGLRIHRCPGPAARVAGPTTRPTTGPTRQPAPTLFAACPPALQNPRWDVAATPILERVPGCNLKLEKSLAPSGGAFGLNGMEWKGEVRAAAACRGRVYFVQYLVSRRNEVGCLDSRPIGSCSSAGWGVDGSWPYSHGSHLALGGGAEVTVPVQTVDSPGWLHISNPGLSRVRVCVDDEFVTYAAYEDPTGILTSLGWINWTWNALGRRDSGSCPSHSISDDCTGWRLSGAGRKLGEAFGTGQVSPKQALDRSAPIITAASYQMSACSPETACPDAWPPSGGSQAPPATFGRP